MNTETMLREGMRTLAAQVEPPALPGDFYDLVHRRVRQRRLVGGAAVMVLLLVLGLGLVLRPGWIGADGTVAGAPGGPQVGLPDRLRVPPLWTGTVDQSVPGAAAAIFGGKATTNNWDEGRIAVVAAGGDDYRVFNEFTYTAPGFDALLSPDGELVARNRKIRSLKPDRPLSITLPGDPLAFSPDGTLLVYETGDGTTSINGVEHRESRIAVFDIQRRQEIAVIENTDNLDRAYAALSPDNGRLAVQNSNKIRLFQLDRRNPTAYETVTLEGEVLAGPAAWLPGGRSFLTVRPDDSRQTWRLVANGDDTAGVAGSRIDLPVVADARYLRVIGWRTDGTAIAVHGVARPGSAPAEEGTFVPNWGDWDTIRVRLVALVPGAAQPAVLLETPTGIRDLEVAADLAVAGQFRKAGSPDYGPLRPDFAVGLAVLVFVVGLPVTILVAVLRGRATRRNRSAQVR